MNKTIAILLAIITIITFILIFNDNSFAEIVNFYLKLFGTIAFIGTLAWLKIKYNKSVGASGFDTNTPITWKNIKDNYKAYWGKNISPTNLKRQKFNIISVSIIYVISLIFGMVPGTILIILLPIILCWGYWIFFKAKDNNKWFKK
jgi:nicotinamide riboside transporter PnuC